MGGSFAGLTLATTAVSLSDGGPMPSFNLANYGKYIASNTLIVRDTAFAQSFDSFLPGSLGPAITKIWELIRNISYSLLAIFMIYVGAMIMMRKQISSQVVVTAQYAIPRIIISIILITFSMAIGLLGLGLIIPMQTAIIQPIKQASLDAAGGMCVGPVLRSTVLSGSIYRVGVGMVFILLSMGINLLTLVLWFMVGIKYLFTYVKLIAATVSSPLTFAWGAIPGNEESITNWFKYFLANMLALPAMVLTMEIGNFIINTLIIQSVASSFGEPSMGANNPAVIMDAMGGYILGGILGYYMLFMALKMPKMIEEGLLGEPGGKKRR
jgi:hypothetical protein